MTDFCKHFIRRAFHAGDGRIIPQVSDTTWVRNSAFESDLALLPRRQFLADRTKSFDGKRRRAIVVMLWGNSFLD